MSTNLPSFTAALRAYYQTPGNLGKAQGEEIDPDTCKVGAMKVVLSTMSDADKVRAHATLRETGNDCAHPNLRSDGTV